MSNIQKTLSIIKPDAVQRNLTEEIKSMFKRSLIESKNKDFERGFLDEILHSSSNKTIL